MRIVQARRDRPGTMIQAICRSLRRPNCRLSCVAFMAGASILTRVGIGAASDGRRLRASSVDFFRIEAGEGGGR